ncbi:MULTISPECIES: UDP-N-acetyl-D-mannosamine dehydrogenase [unclassified Arthrobacter]|uniref:UDP-N-acetyl-D-mannosamine dehydrogenase n=1 Tax=unclassified Arthrobacter TaxID=235627 RepID=UPI0014918471|nr:MULTISPECIES: UDP-N-acetyl-D-mannosamine dehydrogenase [unclassified Arthrobacter]MBE0010359.1 UDP-N-acetyl-D-mannosamine dehydrogenase [Arthrobacter sp. AET 35A]NOJ64186.1 UDP-N-acetyl-D-mannosamine dehydrogenase [Arthrobacter sp. 147(2020)]
MNSIRKVAVIGLGYIGLPTAAILATNGLQVVGVDIKRENVDAINRGEVPFVEPDLNIHVAGAVSVGALTATTETPSADAFILAVPTPFNADRTADLSYIEAAARGLAPKLEGGELIILESTSPPGTTQHLADYLIGLRPDLSLDGANDKPIIHVAHCPERVLPGRVMIELVTNDRIVGGITNEATELARQLYHVFCQGDIHLTDAATAEMAKLVENAYRDVNIAFANELSVISDKVGIDVWELIELANHHPRVNILQPGPGVGGHCIAVDPWFIVSAAPHESKLIRQARETNDAKPAWVIDQVKIAVKSAGKDAKVAALGLAFKANIDDLRESPAVEIVRQLSQDLDECSVLVAEPHVTVLPRSLSSLTNVQLMATESAVRSADVVLLLVDHDEFKEMDRAMLEGKAVVDTRGIWR